MLRDEKMLADSGDGPSVFARASELLIVFAAVWFGNLKYRKLSAQRRPPR